MSGKITGEMIKELRSRTGVGMSKCKEALIVGEGDIQKAIEHLRKTGITSAVKKAGRDTKEGLIDCGAAKDALALAELNAETDFVAKTPEFKEFLKNIAFQAAQSKPPSLEAFLEEPYAKDPSLTIEHYCNLLTQKFGENITLKRLEVITKPKDVSFGIYSHMSGKIVTVVEVDGASGEEAFAKEIAMHVAAADPDYLSSDDIPKEVIKKEEEIAADQIKGKPEHIIGKIITGKLQAYFDEVCLLNQKYVKDNALTVRQFVEAYSKKLNKPLAVRRFWRWKVG